MFAKVCVNKDWFSARVQGSKVEISQDKTPIAIGDWNGFVIDGVDDLIEPEILEALENKLSL